MSRHCFFQVDEADEYRKPGLSKERRLEPQIIIGLLFDKKKKKMVFHWDYIALRAIKPKPRPCYRL